MFTCHNLALVSFINQANFSGFFQLAAFDLCYIFVVNFSIVFVFITLILFLPHNTAMLARSWEL